MHQRQRAEKILDDRKISTRGRAGATTESRGAVKFRAMRSYSAAPERQPKAGPRRKPGQRPGVCRDKSMHRSMAAVKFRAMRSYSAAPERQPKARRGENPGNVWACAATNLCTEAGRGEVSGNEILFCRAGATTESRARRSFGQ